MTKVIILKACPPGACPRLLLSGKHTIFRDDYNKKGFSVSNRLIRKLQTL